MRNFLLGCGCGLIVGVIGATYAISTAQTPEWYRDTLQGQYQQRMDIQGLQYEQDRQALKDSYRDPWKSPCP